MAHVYRTHTLRSFKGHLARFLAIVAIVALGAGVFSGLRMFVPDMYETADQHFDQGNLADLRITSSLGLTAADIDAIKSAPGVTGAQGVISAEVSASHDTGSYQISLTGIDLGALDMSPHNNNYINQIEVLEGRLPQNDHEIALNPVAGQDLKLGDALKIERVVGSADTGDVLSQNTFTIVGFIDTPDHVSLALGVSPLSGMTLTNFGIINASAFVHHDVFTDAMVTVAGAKQQISLTQAYVDTVEPFKQPLKILGQKRASLRAAEITDQIDEALATAQAAYDEGKTTLDESLADARAKLAAGEHEYQAGLSQYNQGLAALRDGQAEIKAAQAILNQSRQHLDDGEAVYAQGKASYESQAQAATPKLNAAQAQVDEGWKKLNRAKRELDGIKVKLDQVKTDADELGRKRDDLAHQMTGIDQQITQIETEIAALKSDPDESNAEQIKNLEAQRDELAATKTKLTAQKNELDMRYDAASAELQAAQAQYDQGNAAYQAQYNQQAPKLKAAQSEIDAQWAKLNAARDTLAQKRTELDAGWDQYHAGQDEFAASVDRSDRAMAELRVAQQRLAESRTKLDQGQADLDQAEVEGEAKLSDAKIKMQQAKDKKAELKQPLWYVLDRNAMPSYSTYKANAERINAITSIFPIFFFLVAALVVLTTMTRMVGADRIEIGTLKALGYSRGQIAKKYLLFSGLASSIGSTIGIAIMSLILPLSIWNSYRSIYGKLSFVLSLQIWDCLLAFGLCVGLSLIVTWLTARLTLRESAASLMLPRAPLPGKRILLERLGPIWRRMNFFRKVTLRNIFRYKPRLIMTVIGIAGCTALMLTGFGIQDKLDGFIERQYYQIQSYDMTVVFDPKVDEQAALGKEISVVGNAINQAHPAGSWSFVLIENVLVQNPDATIEGIPYGVRTQVEKTGGSAQAMLREGRSDSILVGDKTAAVGEVGETESLSVSSLTSGSQANNDGLVRDANIQVLPKDQDINEFYQLTDVNTKKTIVPEEGSLIITQRLAEILQVKPGDTLYLARDAADIGMPIKVSHVVEAYALHSVFMTEKTYENLFHEPVRFNSAWVHYGGDLETRKAASLALRNATSTISSVVLPEEISAHYVDLTKNLRGVVVLIISVSAMLAFIVLYNLTNINIEERAKEIATIKVLGFYRSEVYTYIFRETMALTTFGVVVGLGLGVALCTYIMRSTELDNVMFLRAIDPSSFVISAVLTFVFAVCVAFIMAGKLNKIDMASSLKANE